SQEAAAPPNAATTNPASPQPGSTKTAASATPASDSEESDTADKPETANPAKPAPKPRPVDKPTPTKPADRVAEAEKYIYGRGVSKYCDRGLRILRPAAKQANPKAMVSLGALYSAGLCTPRDLPTAYRWFALALRKEPENQPLQADLQKLWS